MRPGLLRGLAVAGGVTLALSACGAGEPPASSSPGATSSAAIDATSAQRPCVGSPAPSSIEHVVWLVMENHGRDQVVGSKDAPYFNRLLEGCGYAANDHAVAHPSLPNYLALTSGSTHGVTRTELPTTLRIPGPSLFSQLGAGRWRTLAQAMPKNCTLTNAGTYVPRHNPATYYASIVDQCLAQSVPLRPSVDLSAPFTLIVPDQRSNTHDTDVAYGDRWLAGFMPAVFDTPEYRAGRTVVVVTYDEDEDEGNPDNPIATVVIAPSVKPGTVSRVRFTHYSLLRTTEELLALPLLGEARTATSMSDAFTLVN